MLMMPCRFFDDDDAGVADAAYCRAMMMPADFAFAADIFSFAAIDYCCCRGDAITLLMPIDASACRRCR